MMNDMAKDGDMKGASKKRLVPELRFPEFEQDGEWEEKRLGDLCEIGNGKDYKHLNKGRIPVYGSGGYMTSVDAFLYDGDSVCIGRKGTIDRPIFLTGKFWTVDTLFYTHSFCCCLPKFLYWVFQQIDWYRYNEAGGVPSLSKKTIENIKHSFPSSAEQQKIAECLSSMDEEISAMKEKVEQLKIYKKGLMQKLFPVAGKFVPELRFPKFKKDWDVDSMQSMFDMKNGYTPSKSNPTYWDNGTIPWFRMEDIRKNGHILSDSIQHVTQQAVKNSGLFPAYSIIVATTATIGEHALVIVDSLANQRFTFLTKRKSFKDKINMMYFHHYMFIIDEWCKKNTNSGGLVSVNMPAFKQLLIPFPSPAEQQKIADSLSSIDELISLYENKVILLEQHTKGLMQQLFPKL
ncbi:MAG: restriction endonuclease subunit S [Paraprevotella sp.]|nr:restriction endonuclease subunit S [Paraprevotella sp.]